MSDRPILAAVDSDRIDRELRKIVREIREHIGNAMKRRASGRKITVEVVLDTDGYPDSDLTRYQPPWQIGGRNE